MEPPLGQLSFFLLCLQFSRAQMANIGARPFTGARPSAFRRVAGNCDVPRLHAYVPPFPYIRTAGMLQSKKAASLIEEYPQYERSTVDEFARSDSVLATES